ncbi:MAG: hypothetical protein AMXMBFR82_19820 [Candidatus Hydrogenedentota bacterium]
MACDSFAVREPQNVRIDVGAYGEPSGAKIQVFQQFAGTGAEIKDSTAAGDTGFAQKAVSFGGEPRGLGLIEGA